jgi:hypothetical protein
MICIFVDNLDAILKVQNRNTREFSPRRAVRAVVQYCTYGRRKIVDIGTLSFS